MRKLVIALLVFIVPLHAQFVSSGPWMTYIQGEGRIGGFREGTGLTLFLPLCQNQNGLGFFDCSVGWWKDSQTLDLGLGIRYKYNQNLAYGINGFLDYAYSRWSNTFVQGGAGLELISSCWGARANGYFNASQQGKVRRIIRPSGVFREDQISYWGGDVEGGYSIHWGWGYLWGWIGYYHYRRNGQPTMQGPRARIEYRFRDFFGWCGTETFVAGEYEYDQVRKGEGSFYCGFAFPLTCGRPACCKPQSTTTRMNLPVFREKGIWYRKFKRFIPNN